MKFILMASIVGLTTGTIQCQENAVRIMLAATSSTPAAYLLKHLPESGCPNVSIVLEETKADYILEAHGGDFEGAQGSEGPHGPRAPRPRARYTLVKNGAVVFGTTPVKEKNAVKDLCKYLQKGSSK
jgi:hypothetical protein